MYSQIQLKDIPLSPAVYALYAGKARNEYVAYVGATSSIRHRLGEHLIRRNSSVTTGVSAVSLRTELVSKASWWCLPKFKSVSYRDAAELIAFDVLNPVLRSRRRLGPEVRNLASQRPFRDEITRLLNGPPSGTLTFAADSRVIEAVKTLERRVSKLESVIFRSKRKP